MGIQLLSYSHREEQTTSHDTIWDAFHSIAKDGGFHVGLS